MARQNVCAISTSASPTLQPLYPSMSLQHMHAYRWTTALELHMHVQATRMRPECLCMYACQFAGSCVERAGLPCTYCCRGDSWSNSPWIETHGNSSLTGVASWTSFLQGHHCNRADSPSRGSTGSMGVSPQPLHRALLTSMPRSFTGAQMAHQERQTWLQAPAAARSAGQGRLQAR